MTKINTERVNQPYRNRLMVDTSKLYQVYCHNIELLRYLITRDEMNAQLHGDTPTWSYLTEVAEANKVELEELLKKGDKK